MSISNRWIIAVGALTATYFILLKQLDAYPEASLTTMWRVLIILFLTGAAYLVSFNPVSFIYRKVTKRDETT
jgi:hypothetical protein